MNEVFNANSEKNETPVSQISDTKTQRPKIKIQESNFKVEESEHNLRKMTPSKYQSYENFGLNKLYDDMFIFGCDKSKLKNFSADDELENSTLFSLYSSHDKDTQSALDQLSKFVLPFSKKFKILKVKNNFAKLQEVIFDSKNRVDFSYFSLNGVSSAGFQFTNEQQKLLKTHPEFEILKKTNPNNYYFYYCIRIDDFFINDKNSNTIQTDLIELYFYSNAFIVKTIYPFSKLFQNFLENALDFLKRNRLKEFMKLKNEQKIRLQNLLKLDGNAFLKPEIETIVGCFESFDKFCQNSIKLQNDPAF